jgi:hypothetical protein
MASSLNKVPRGLLDFFNIKQQGRNPEYLSETLVGLLDILPWYTYTSASWSIFSTDYSVAQTEDAFNVITAASRTWGTVLPDDGVTIAVPQNEVWLITEWSEGTRVGAPAANNGGAVPCYRDPTYATIGALPVPCSPLTGFQATAGSNGYVESHLDRFPFFLQGGAQLGRSFFGGLATAGSHFTSYTNLRVVRMTN